MSPHSLRLLPVWLLACLNIVGCTSVREYVGNGFKVGPNYRRPAAPVADDWIDSQNPKVSSESASLQSWWQVFHDPVLNNLVQTSYQQNLTLREVGFRVAEAQAQRGVVAGQLFPQSQELLGDFNRFDRSTQTALFPQLPPGSPFSNLGATRYNNWRIGSSLAWELDFWGRYRRAIDAADARLDASVEDYDDALVLLIGEVASTYIELRTLDQRLQVARQNAVLQNESVRVAQARFDAMAANSELDTPQAKSNLGNTLAAVEALEISRRRSQNRLSVLMGVPPHDLTSLLGDSAEIPVPPDVVTAGVPAELIWKRPDVRRAERLVAAQSEEIGIAQAELYPHISINGMLSWEAGRFSDIFKGGAFGGSIGPSFRWNVLNYGRLLNNIRVQDARFQQLIANYQQTVLTANEEAENAIVAYLHFADQVRVLEESARQALEAERVAQIKYREGEIDFNRLFTVQQLLLSQQESLAGARANAAQSLVDLYRALGGGWEIRLESAGAEIVVFEDDTNPTPLSEPTLPQVPLVPGIQEEE